MTRWSTVKLADVATLNPTRPRQLLNLDDSHAVTFVPMPAVNQYSGEIDGAQTRPFGEVKKGFTYFADGDVIFAKITPCMQNGKSAIASGLVNGLGFGSTEFHVIRPNVDRLLPDWVWYFVRQTSFRDEAMRHFRGAVGQQRVPVDYLGNANIPLPPVPEQRRIVSRIEACMERVDEIERLRDRVKREAAGIELACFHDSLVDGIESKGWPVLTLGDVAKSFRYGTSAKAHSEAEGLPVLRMGNLQRGYLDFTALKYVNLPATEMARYKLNVGDILINRTNSLELVGKAATFGVEDGEWLYASYLVRVEVDRKRVIPDFVTSVINSTLGRDYVLRTARRAIGMVNLNAKEMAKFPIPVPSLDEQQQVVARLIGARRLAEELRASITGPEIGFLRSSILQRAFAGEL